VFTTRVDEFNKQRGLGYDHLVDSMIELFGKCTAELEHRGPTTFEINGTEPERLGLSGLKLPKLHTPEAGGEAGDQLGGYNNDFSFPNQWNPGFPSGFSQNGWPRYGIPLQIPLSFQNADFNARTDIYAALKTLNNFGFFELPENWDDIAAAPVNIQKGRAHNAFNQFNQGVAVFVPILRRDRPNAKQAQVGAQANNVCIIVQGDQIVNKIFAAQHNFFQEGATHFHFHSAKDTATAGGDNTLTDSAASFGELTEGTPIYIISGTGAGQTRYVLSNTATVITVSEDWTTNPDATSEYIVGGTHIHNHTVFTKDVEFTGTVTGAGGDGKVKVHTGDASDFLEDQVECLTSGVYDSAEHTRICFERINDNLLGYFSPNSYTGTIPDGENGIIVYRDGVPTVEAIHDPYVTRSTTNHTFTGTPADMPLDAELASSSIGTFASDEVTTMVDGAIAVSAKVCLDVNGGSPSGENTATVKLQCDDGGGYSDVNDGEISIYLPNVGTGIGCGHLEVQLDSAVGNKYKLVMTRVSGSDTLQNVTESTMRITPLANSIVDTVHYGLQRVWEPISSVAGTAELASGALLSDIESSDVSRNGSFTCGPLGNAFRLGGTTVKAMRSDTLAFNPDSDWSMSFWWRAPTSWEVDSDNVAKMVIRSDTGAHLVVYWQESTFGSTSVFFGAQYSKEATSSGNTFIFLDALGTTTCYHTVFTWDSAAEEMKYYLNGTLDTTDSSPSNWTFSPEPSAEDLFSIHSIGDSTRTVDVSQIACYNRKLSAQAVTDLYNSGSGVSL